MDLLTDLVGGRVYFDRAPDQVGIPYIVLLQVGGDPVEFLDGPSDMDLIRLQIDVYSETRTSANELMSQARIRLRTLQASAIGAPVSLHESAVGLYRRSCDFRILASA
ncbi:DUF3168 domain-containing protein [Herbaspirillum huttiense]|uniref:DUF3168 domain-containing protein n=1 Tax=Herbaspirillum huttiense TaxID=863372 RepID=UPI003813DA50